MNFVPGDEMNKADEADFSGCRKGSSRGCCERIVDAAFCQGLMPQMLRLSLPLLMSGMVQLKTRLQTYMEPDYDIGRPEAFISI